MREGSAEHLIVPLTGIHFSLSQEQARYKQQKTKQGAKPLLKGRIGDCHHPLLYSLLVAFLRNSVIGPSSADQVGAPRLERDK